MFKSTIRHIKPRNQHSTMLQLLLSYLTLVLLLKCHLNLGGMIHMSNLWLSFQESLIRSSLTSSEFPQLLLTIVRRTFHFQSWQKLYYRGINSYLEDNLTITSHTFFSNQQQYLPSRACDLPRHKHLIGFILPDENSFLHEDTKSNQKVVGYHLDRIAIFIPAS